MGQFSHIVRCSDLGRSDIVQALVSPDTAYELCARLSFVSRTGETSTALLRVFALLASGSAEWLHGELRVTLEASGAHTIMTAFERTSEGRFVELFPPLRFALSLPELRQTVETNPELLGGLELWEAPRGMELGLANGAKQGSVVPRSRSAASGVRPAMNATSGTGSPKKERPSTSPTRRQTTKVQIPMEELRKLKDG